MSTNIFLWFSFFCALVLGVRVCMYVCVLQFHGGVTTAKRGSTPMLQGAIEKPQTRGGPLVAQVELQETSATFFGAKC